MYQILPISLIFLLVICVPCPRSYVAYATLICTFYYYYYYWNAWKCWQLMSHRWQRQILPHANHTCLYSPEQAWKHLSHTAWGLDCSDTGTCTRVANNRMEKQALTWFPENGKEKAWNTRKVLERSKVQGYESVNIRSVARIFYAPATKSTPTTFLPMWPFDYGNRLSDL